MKKHANPTTLVHHVIQIIVTPPIQELKNGNFLERLHFKCYIFVHVVMGTTLASTCYGTELSKHAENVCPNPNNDAE
jgi:hypothetical protein